LCIATLCGQRGDVVVRGCCAADIDSATAGGSECCGDGGSLLVAFLCFTTLLMLLTSAVYAYTVLARMYNVDVAPVVMSGQWLSVLLDFVFCVVVQLWNCIVFFRNEVLREVLRKVVLPYSSHNIETLPEILQGLSLMLVRLGSSIRTWLDNLMECTLLHEDALRICGVSSELGLRRDCTTMFTATYMQCFASPNHLTLDLVTPGLFGRQVALACAAPCCGALRHCVAGAEPDSVSN
jgi:hypothetical protein